MAMKSGRKLPKAESEAKNRSEDIDEFFTKEELDGLSDYEKNRFRNMRRNYELMKAVGLPATKPEFMTKRKGRGRVKQLHRQPLDDSDSDEEWTPESEIMRRSSRESKRVVPFCAPSEKSTAKRMKKECNRKQEKKTRALVHDAENTNEGPSHSYPLRQLPPQNYMDLEPPEDDDFIFCEDCDKEYEDDCPVHGPYVIVNDKQLLDLCEDEERPYKTLPDGLSVSTSGIPNAGLGVWAEKTIPARTRFGPYEGEITVDVDQAHSTGYSWQIYHQGNPKHFVNAFSMKASNWMRFVNCARSEAEQNLVAYQYKGQIYYRTFREIKPGTELLVWYGHDYGKELGIIRTNQDIQPKIVNGEVMYRCPWCPVSLGTIDFLSKHCKFKHGQVVGNEHSRKYEGDDIYRCPGCDISFSHIDYLIRHARHVHKINIRGKNEAEKKHHSTESLSNHNMGSYDVVKQRIKSEGNLKDTGTHGGISYWKEKNPNKPSICDNRNRYNHQLAKINQNKHPGHHLRGNTSSEKTQRKNTGWKNPNVSKVCGYSTSDMGPLKTHQRIHTGDKPNKCDVCGYSTTRMDVLKIHQRIHTGDKPYKCDVCGYSTTRMGNLKTHQRIHTGDKPYKCDVCGYSTNVMGNLKTHQRIHTGDKPNKCDVCGYSTTRMDVLKIHQRIHTGDKPYKCDVCGYSTTRMGNLKTHQRIHTGDKPYKCDVCGYSTNVMGNLKTHQRIHTGDKPYKCDVCGYSTTTMGNLKTHQRIHTGDKPYKCDVCGYSTTRMGDLKTHQRIHTGDKPYKCDVCGYSTTRMGDLKTHQRIHTGDKPYKCDVCGFSASDHIILKKHQLIHMKISEP